MQKETLKGMWVLETDLVYCIIFYIKNVILFKSLGWVRFF